MKKSLILIAVVALGIPSLAWGDLPCCDDRGPGPDVIPLDCCAVTITCLVHDAGIQVMYGHLLTQHIGWKNCNDCWRSCYDPGAAYVAHGSTSCVRCGGGGSVLTLDPRMDLFPPPVPGASLLLPVTTAFPSSVGQIPEGAQRVTTPTASPTHTVMGPDGTVYVVSDTIRTWTVGNQSFSTLNVDLNAAIGEPNSTAVHRRMLHGIAFLGSDAQLLWTAVTREAYTTYLTSLSDHSTTTLNKVILAQDLAIAPNGDLYVIGTGPDLSLGVHKFSASGLYLRSFSQAPSVEPKRILATANRLYVQEDFNTLAEYTFAGQINRTYNFDDRVPTDKSGLINGVFVRDGKVHVNVVPANPGAPDSGCLYGWFPEDTATLYRMVNGQFEVHSTSKSDTVLYGIDPNGTKIGRSLLVGSQLNPAITTVGNETP